MAAAVAFVVVVVVAAAPGLGEVAGAVGAASALVEAQELGPVAVAAWRAAGPTRGHRTAAACTAAAVGTPCNLVAGVPCSHTPVVACTAAACTAVACIAVAGVAGARLGESPNL